MGRKSDHQEPLLGKNERESEIPKQSHQEGESHGKSRTTVGWICDLLEPLWGKNERDSEIPHQSHQEGESHPKSRTETDWNPDIHERGTASGIQHQSQQEGGSNGESDVNGGWKCNTNVCGLADTSSVAAKEERSEATKKLTRAVLFCVVFMIVEIIGGIKAGSLAVLTDAVHLSSDVASFAISLFAVWAGSWEANHRHTFGFYRAEVLGALISILIIWLITGSIVYEAIDRLFTQQDPIDGRLMFIVASLGLAVNLGMMVLLGDDHGHGGHGHGHKHSGSHEHSPNHHHESDHSHDHGDLEHHDDEESRHVSPQEQTSLVVDGKSSDPDEHRQECRRLNLVVKGYDEIIVCVCGEDHVRENVNVKSAYLHVLGDLVQSVGVMIGGAVIWWKPEWMIVDLICTFVFSLVVLVTTLKMVSDILAVLMESTPREIDAKALQDGLVKIEGVSAVHELHIWAITLGKVILACHVTIEPSAESDVVLQKVIHYCDSKFKISHVTIQIERKKAMEQKARDLEQGALQSQHSEGHCLGHRVHVE